MPDRGFQGDPRQRSMKKLNTQVPSLIERIFGHTAPEPRVVLVVDDEEAVRRIARMILERAGYCVLEAPDGLRALELLYTYSGPIDLIVCDIVMPHLSGTGLVERLKKEQPDLKVLFISGQVEDSPIVGVELLRKPFTAQALQAAVMALLLDKSTQ
jgi:two-component system, cell cycle sensor histidine kinase and response regulator CckA